MSGERPLPERNEAAEAAVLGAMMLGPVAVVEAREILTPDDFYRPAHATVFTALCELADQAAPTDTIAVADQLRRRGQLESVGAAPGLHELLSSAATAASVGYHAELVVACALRRRIAAAGVRLTQLAADPGREPGETLAVVLDELSETSSAACARRGSLTNVVSGTWLDAQTFPPLRFVVPGLVPEGTTVLAGPPKIGKSWCVLQIALAVAAGGIAFGCLAVGDARPVLYLALEDGHRRLQARCRSLLGPGEPIPAAVDFVVSCEPDTALRTVRDWIARHADTSPVVVVDTLARVMPVARTGETQYQRDYRAVGQLHKLVAATSGGAMVIVHHTRKLASEDFVDSVSGTLGVSGAADTTVVLSRARGEKAGVLRVTGRDVWEAEYELVKANDGTWALSGGSLSTARDNAAATSATADLGDRSTEVYRLVVEAGPEGIGPTAVARKIGIEPKDAGNYLLRLETADRIRKVRRGVYRAPDSEFDTFDRFDTPHREGRPETPSNPPPDDSVERVDTVETPGQKVESISTSSAQEKATAHAQPRTTLA